MNTAPETAPVQGIEDVIFNAPVGTEFCCTDECYDRFHVVSGVSVDRGTPVKVGECNRFKIAEAGRVVGGERVVTIDTFYQGLYQSRSEAWDSGSCEVKVSTLSRHRGGWKINEREGWPLCKDRAEALYNLDDESVRCRCEDTVSEVRRLMVEAGKLLGYTRE